MQSNILKSETGAHARWLHDSMKVMPQYVIITTLTVPKTLPSDKNITHTHGAQFQETQTQNGILKDLYLNL